MINSWLAQRKTVSVRKKQLCVQKVGTRDAVDSGADREKGEVRNGVGLFLAPIVIK